MGDRVTPARAHSRNLPSETPFPDLYSTANTQHLRPCPSVKFMLRFNNILIMMSLTGSVGTAIKTGVAFALTGVVLLQPYRPMVFMGHSMEPTYPNQSIVLTKPAEPGSLKHGEVVVIDLDSGPIVKRIAFLPGDKFLQMRSGDSWLDMIYVHHYLATERHRKANIENVHGSRRHGIRSWR